MLTLTGKVSHVFTTPARLVSNTWRNFYTPDRGDVFAGFRTCALE